MVYRVVDTVCIREDQTSHGSPMVLYPVHRPQPQGRILGGRRQWYRTTQLRGPPSSVGNNKGYLWIGSGSISINYRNPISVTLPR